jgi:hypothetical protein
MPSRSTVFTPLAAASSKASTNASGNRLISSTYSTPRCAFASKPGEKRSAPSRSALSISSVPIKRSSLAPSGKVTSCPSGSSSANARAAVDLAVPRGPLTSTPPRPGSIAASNRACCNDACPTSAANGNAGRAAGVLRSSVAAFMVVFLR